MASAPLDDIKSLKLIMLGDPCVGKSTFAVSFLKHKIIKHENEEEDICTNSITRPFLIENDLVQFHVKDPKSMRIIYPDCMIPFLKMLKDLPEAAIVMYDVNNSYSYRRVQEMIGKLKVNYPNMVIALVGNKADLEEERFIDADIASRYANANGLLFMEASGAHHMNVDEMFFAIAKQILKKTGCQDKQRGVENAGKVLDDIKNQLANSSSYCCSK